MDNHFPHLSVEQTLRFAIACRTPRSRIDDMSRQEFQDFFLQVLATIFGLREVLHTKVGNDYVRGVSGGQRKRVSIAEACSARAAIYCWDNATRGLDASTALEYAQAIRAATNFLNNVGVVAIYQAGENIYNLFDKVTVLYLGRQVYFGPAEQGKDYFVRMGWECPSRQTTAEFLTAVTDPNGRTPRPGMENKVPKNADEFEAYWRASPEFALLQREIAQYNSENSSENAIKRFHDVKQHEKMKSQPTKSRYLITFRSQLKYTMIRGFQRVVGDKAYTIISLMGALFQALIVGSLFYNITPSTTGAFSRGGVLFFSVLYLSLMSMAEINNIFANRPILVKQRAYSFYHPAAESLQSIFSEFPTRFLSTICFAIVMYFLSRLKQTAGQFFFFLLVLLVTSMCISDFFQMICAFLKEAQSAHAIAGIAVLILVIYTGYMIPLVSMHPWFKWLSYLNPLRYAFESLMANEFHGRVMSCGNVVPRGPGYENVSGVNRVCGFVGSTIGSIEVIGDRYIKLAYDYSWSHAWRNFGLVVVFYVGFYTINCLATTVINPVIGGGDLLLFKRGHIPDKIEEHVVEINADDVQGLSNYDGEPDIFSWKHVNYSVPITGGQLQLLNDVQGYVKPGTMTALMGESGAGKTTLLNVLSKRVDIGVVSGDFLINGKPLDDSFQRRTGYVQQQDLHLAEATVRESLRFAARLRQPESTPDSEKLEYVEKIIRLLGMSSYAEALVGQSGRGLNVEQRKKLSIGVELVARPSLLLFLDEPTSGLDSQSAWAIVSFMRELAKAGQSILCTIHQPSATLFEQFDRLLLLKKGGRTVYFGDIGENSSILTSYFERNGSHKCQKSENPAEYILDCIGAGATAAVNKDWGDIWNNSPECAAVSQEIDELNERLRSRPESNKNEHLTRKYAIPIHKQFYYVYKRTSLQFWRSPQYVMAKFVLMVVAGLFIGFTFWNVDYSVAGMQNAMFGIFLTQVVSSALSNQIEGFAEQSRDLYEVRESKSNTFHWGCLLVSQWLSEIPYHIVFSTLLFIGFYFPVGYPRDAATAGYFYLVYCIFFQLYYTSFALVVMYFSPDSGSASIITSLFFSLMISFCGVLQPKSQMPGFWTFMWKVSPYTYFIQSYMLIVFHKRPVICSPFEFSILDPLEGQTCAEYLGPFLENAFGYVDNPNATSNCEFCPFSVGDQYLATIDTSYSYKWRNVGFFCAYICFNIIAMLVLYYLFRVKSWNLPNPKNLFKKKDKTQSSSSSLPKEPTPPDYGEAEHNDNFYTTQAGDEKMMRKVDSHMVRKRKQSVANPEHLPVVFDIGNSSSSGEKRVEQL